MLHVLHVHALITHTGSETCLPQVLCTRFFSCSCIAMDASSSSSGAVQLAPRARRRWVILRRGVPVRVRGGAYAPWQILYFKTVDEAEDYAEGFVMCGNWQQQDVKTAPTIVFDYTLQTCFPSDLAPGSTFRPH